MPDRRVSMPIVGAASASSRPPETSAESSGRLSTRFTIRAQMVFSGSF